MKKKMMESCLVFHLEKKMVFEKFNCVFIDLLKYSFGRIKIISTTHNQTDLVCISDERFY